VQPDRFSDGFEKPPSTHLGWDPRLIPGLLVGYRQAYLEIGARPSQGEFPIDDGAWTTTAMETVIAGHKRERANHLLDDTTYYVDPIIENPIVFGYQQPPTGGWTLACFVFRYRAVYRSASGGELAQNATANNWGGWLAPGSYSSITAYGLHQTCASVPPPGSLGLIHVIGDEGGTVDVRGAS
jgi:hypothetical protein